MAAVTRFERDTAPAVEPSPAPRVAPVATPWLLAARAEALRGERRY